MTLSEQRQLLCRLRLTYPEVGKVEALTALALNDITHRIPYYL